MVPVIIWDLDGTLCNVEHRLHHIRGETKDWDAFHAACVDDTPNPAIVKLYRSLSLTPRCANVIFSGRTNNHERATREWLMENGIHGYEALWMRPFGDYRPDVELKAGFLAELRRLNLEPILAVDDRPDIVKLWRAEGIPVVEVLSPNWARPGIDA